MDGEGDLFLRACGASGPLRLEWDDWTTGEVVRRDFGRPAALVGRNPTSDLMLDEPRVSKRHAYLQLVDDRLFALDLDSRDGLRWSGVPRRSGWVDRDRPVQIGPTTIRVVGDRSASGGFGSGPGPTSRRFESRNPLPGAVLRLLDDGVEPTRLPLDRVLTLVGSSPLCRIRWVDPELSRYACSLLRTPSGVWLVDLLSSRGVSVNGVARREVRIEDGDVVKVGGRSFRLTYQGSAAYSPPPDPPRAGAGPPPDSLQLPAWPGRALPEATDENWELIPELILRHLPGHDVTASEASPRLDHTFLMLIRLLGEMHRDHLQVVREEMEQIRRLNREMGSLRAQLGRAETAVTETGSGQTPGEGESTAPVPEAGPKERPDLRIVQSLVGSRLEAWEKERQSRWKKVIGLLVKP